MNLTLFLEKVLFLSGFYLCNIIAKVFLAKDRIALLAVNMDESSLFDFCCFNWKFQDIK